MRETLSEETLVVRDQSGRRIFCRSEFENEAATEGDIRAFLEEMYVVYRRQSQEGSDPQSVMDYLAGKALRPIRDRDHERQLLYYMQFAFWRAYNDDESLLEVGQEIEQLLMRSYFMAIVKNCHKYKREESRKEYVEQASYLATKAIRRFDLEFGVRLSTYVFWALNMAHDRRRRDALRFAQEKPVSDFRRLEKGDSIIHEAEELDRLERLRQVIEALLDAEYEFGRGPRRLNGYERYLIENYCLPDGERLSSQRIGELRGVSKQAVHTKMQQLLRKLMERANEFGYIEELMELLDIEEE